MTTIGILARSDLDEAGPAIRDLVTWLQARGATACLDKATAALGGAGTPAGCRVRSGREVARSHSVTAPDA